MTASAGNRPGNRPRGGEAAGGPVTWGAPTGGAGAAGPRTGPALDPDTVPLYPVVAVRLDGDGTAWIDGQQLPLPHGVDPHRALIAAAAERAAELANTPAIRVTATDRDGATVPLIVTRDAQIVPVDVPAPRRPAWLWPLVAAAAAVLVAVTVVLATGGSGSGGASQPARTSAAPVPLPATGVGANLPVDAPPGYATTAAWSLPVDATLAPVSTTDGLILAATADHDLVLLDPVTGRPYWTGRDLPSGISDLHITRIDGQRAAAVSTGSTLTYWPLPSAPARATTAGPAATAPVSVDLPQRATMLWAPTSPIIKLPDQTAGIIHAGKVVTLDLPVGSEAVDADTTGVLALDTALGTPGRWWHLTPGAPIPAPASLPVPTAATGSMLRAGGLDVEHVLAVWPTTSSRTLAVLIDLPSGRILADTVLATDAAIPPVIAEPGASRAAMGAVLVDVATASLIPLTDGLSPKVLSGPHLYATTSTNAVVDVEITSGQITTAPTTATQDSIPLGILTRPTPLALITAQKISDRVLYALPPAGTR